MRSKESERIRARKYYYRKREEILKKKALKRKINTDEVRRKEREYYQESKEGYTVIVDNTHIAPKCIPYFKDTAKRFFTDFKIKQFTADKWDCVERDKNEKNLLGRSYF